MAEGEWGAGLREGLLLESHLHTNLTRPKHSLKKDVFDRTRGKVEKSNMLSEIVSSNK